MDEFRPDAVVTALITLIAVVAMLAIVAAMISIAGNCRLERRRSKAEAAARKANIERIERIAAIRRAYNLDKLPPSGKRPANPGPGLSPHPLRVSNLAHVIQPASDLPNMQSIGDHVGWDCSGASDTPATLCMPVDIDSTPESAGQP
jgi:hypothetical protein